VQGNSAPPRQKEEQSAPAADEGITAYSVQDIADRLKEFVTEVTSEEFRWQHAHYNHDSRYGRELLFLIANSGWIRATRETVDITRSDAVDTAIQIDINLDQITHEAFHVDTPYIWLPLLVLPPPRTEEAPQADRADGIRPNHHQPERSRNQAAKRVSRPKLRLRSDAGQANVSDPFSTLKVSYLSPQGFHRSSQVGLRVTTGA
jgi:hypothetical protein